ncbi:MAG: UDP-N-acetylmuramate--L-alanine ligase [Chitinophagaceae bacterium]
MINLQNIRSVYLIGIGGIGMSALARYFKEKGAVVSGYDKTVSSLTQQLSLEGISIHYVEDLQQTDLNPDLVIYTPAIPEDHKELVYYLEKQIPVYKRSEVLGAIVKNMFCIAVAGTHGKTTTSTLIAHILRESGYGCNTFLGGISVNYYTNYWSSNNNVGVIEADEYDRSFLQLEPDIAILTAMDPDHLDIYGTEEAMREAYILFTKQIKVTGKLIYKYGLKRYEEMGGEDHLAYSLENRKADSYAQNIYEYEGGYQFDIVNKENTIANVQLNIGGRHNIENAVAATAVAGMLGIPVVNIKQGISSFKGVKRRFEYIIKNELNVYIDDYAHHPEELKALIHSAMSLFKERKCTIIFQPHLFSRTKDLADQFAQALDLANEIILLPVYPAREKPIPGVSSRLIADKMKNSRVSILSREETLTQIKEHKPGLLLTAGAGDIDKLVDPIKNILIDYVKG